MTVESKPTTSMFNDDFDINAGYKALMAGIKGTNMTNVTKPTPSIWDNIAGIFTDRKGAGSMFNNIMSGIGSGFNIYAGMKGLDLAREEFDFTKALTRANLYASQQQFNNAVYNDANTAHMWDSSAHAAPGTVMQQQGVNFQDVHGYTNPYAMQASNTQPSQFNTLPGPAMGSEGLGANPIRNGYGFDNIG